MTGLLTRNPRLIAENDGKLLGRDGPADRFLVWGSETGGQVSLVEHRLPAKQLAAPMHRHAREDEFSWVIEGRVGASLGGRIAVAEAGQLLIKPRGEWHTFWNAGDSPARILEIIAPGGLERLFEMIGEADLVSPEQIARWAADYGCDTDFPATMTLAAEHGLAF